jgi:hypothetical protein
VKAVAPVAKEALTEGAEEVPVLVKDNDGMLPMGEDIHVVLGVHCNIRTLLDTPTLGQSAPSGQFSPSVYIPEKKVTTTVNVRSFVKFIHRLSPSCSMKCAEMSLWVADPGP